METTKYVDYDEESGCYAIFDSETGKCTALFSSEEEAKEFLQVQRIMKQFSIVT